MLRRRALRRRLAAAGGAPLPSASLAALSDAVTAGAGGGASRCVQAPPPARLAALRACRWSDLQEDAQLRRLPACRERDCCNPYHWSRLCRPSGAPRPARDESPPPPYHRFDMDDKLKPEDRAPSEEDWRRTNHERLAPGSLTTDGEERLSLDREWCRLAYWELARRVGRQYGVRPSAVDVWGAGGGAPGRDGLCLDTLCKGSAPSLAPHVTPPAPDAVKKTRAKIGLGVTLSLEEDGVWVYNRSDQPIFVNSPTLDDPDVRALLVYRVPPGHCLCIFDPNKAIKLPPSKAPTGPIDPNSVRISFAKGWGPKYSRQDVTACPCWLEVLLAPCR